MTAVNKTRRHSESAYISFYVGLGRLAAKRWLY